MLHCLNKDFNIILCIALYTLLLGLSWYDTWKLINANLFRAYIAACNKGFNGDIEDFITYLYQRDLMESGIITWVIILSFTLVIEFIKDTLKLIDNLVISCKNMCCISKIIILYADKE